MDSWEQTCGLSIEKCQIILFIVVFVCSVTLFTCMVQD